jgi:flagellar biosynthesis/type III secretory pathway chaperone
MASRQSLTLERALGSEVTEYRTLLTLLRAEQEALRTADADALAHVAQAKLKQVYTLQDIGADRAEIMRQGGTMARFSGNDISADSGIISDEARELWQTLVVLAADAQRQNALNKRLASVQQRHVDRAMAALWGAAGRTDTYGADGRTQHHASPRAVTAI